MNKYDCIIVGGGISGLLSALVLSKEGKKVLVFERNDKLGNNCSSYMVDGYQVTTPEKASVTIDGFIADTKTPIENLYVVGTDADDRSMGVTRAAYSVVKLIKVLKKEGILADQVD
ncbi:MAG: UDP-galactopyranose mutase [Candidatus Methanoperedens nitroreducens]|uniref:UDP-galactopyranose mutase n=1 Tax=Candidatus Methanoperedens nitratireducens TaxID=1392998 RepID=A0A0P8E2S1_9EURY|nr:FAD-dependent oxidoreductase [Candidatus Methanoperedens sp. BLZ2]KAB2946621.1 MAG: FAD-dependent oxidoreductase [Candidatus Methanoperedens sp.]KPQ44653.1 MAG: UDP-galactopyranose mutase [Candidatus Methanoperedens sp. BLZ1]MBZ0173955.1 FAD-dependent oxidoreductase [Candidatus Methanoperedens nitroreducens]CAG0978839.1 hypothetical protein METP2_01841 [Methanosarcinales archaeon]MCX9078942.1 FAD-dependent oxidoreductase [Candidatus Methanoperedens sp.]